MKKILLLLLAVFSISASAQADYYNVLTSTGASSLGRAPQGARVATRSVWFVSQAEMAASGLTVGAVINSLGFHFAQGLNRPVTGNITIYLQNTSDATNLKDINWTTAITGMTTVSNGSVTLSTAAGIFNIPFVNGTSSFTYTGNALYIAFDYQNLTNPLATTSSQAYTDDSHAGGIKTGMAATGAAAPIPTTIASGNTRPVTILGKQVACTTPTNFQETVASKTQNSITITFNSTLPTDIEYGLSGFTPGSGTTVAGITSPYIITGLSNSSVYDIYLKGNCGATQSIPVKQTTNTVYTPATPPYNTSFEQTNFNLLDWSAPSGTPLANNWRIGSGLPVQNGNFSIFSSSEVRNTPANNWVISRGINLTAGYTATVTFYTRNYQDNSSTGSASYNFTVGSSKTVAAQTTIATETPFTSQTWTLKTYTFSPTTSGTYYFGIQNISPANITGTQGLLIDNFTVTQALLSTADFLASQFSVYPNPSNNIINITSDANLVLNNVTITDLNGRTVQSVQFNNVATAQVNISDLSAGMYMMNIASDQGNVTKKIIKN